MKVMKILVVLLLLCSNAAAIDTANFGGYDWESKATANWIAYGVDGPVTDPAGPFSLNGTTEIATETQKTQAIATAPLGLGTAKQTNRLQCGGTTGACRIKSTWELNVPNPFNVVVLGTAENEAGMWVERSDHATKRCKFKLTVAMPSIHVSTTPAVVPYLPSDLHFWAEADGFGEIHAHWDGDDNQWTITRQSRDINGDLVNYDDIVLNGFDNETIRAGISIYHYSNPSPYHHNYSARIGERTLEYSKIGVTGNSNPPAGVAQTYDVDVTGKAEVYPVSWH